MIKIDEYGLKIINGVSIKEQNVWLHWLYNIETESQLAENVAEKLAEAELF